MINASREGVLKVEIVKISNGLSSCKHKDVLEGNQKGFPCVNTLLAFPVNTQWSA